MQKNIDKKQIISSGQTSLGIEFGSTRIKAVLLDKNGGALAVGGHTWENKFVGGIWTYSLEDIWGGVQKCYTDLKQQVKSAYGIVLKNVGAIGISAMMHGFMGFDGKNNLLTPFRTWRNNNAEPAAQKLTKILAQPIPARWSIAHLYQAILNGEAHIADIDFMTTLSGYVHYMLTGEKVMGIGEASGMFPIDANIKDYHAASIESFENLPEVKKYDLRLKNILPKVLVAGENAGFLTAAGAKLLDTDGDLTVGIPFCPPEGDAGTGMVATNSIKKGTGNVSAGTSVFAMLVLEKELKNVHPEIDIVTTPQGDLVAMVHCNNCTSELNAWMDLFSEVIESVGAKVPNSDGGLYKIMLTESLKAEKDAGGLLCYNYLSGENITGITKGRPLFARSTESRFNLANFMRAQLYSAIATLKIGLDILLKEENVKVESIFAHGGIFKTKGVMQNYLAAALDAPVAVTDSADVGGAWGMAVLAMYLLEKQSLEKNSGSLQDYLDKQIFADSKSKVVYPDKADIDGINEFEKNYIKGLSIVKAAETAIGEQ